MSTIERADNIHFQDEFRVNLSDPAWEHDADFDPVYLSSCILYSRYEHLKKKIILHIIQSDRDDVIEFVNYHSSSEQMRVKTSIAEIKIEMIGVAPFDIVGQGATLTDHQVDFMASPTDSESELVPTVHILEFTCWDTQMVPRVGKSRHAATLRLV